MTHAIRLRNVLLAFGCLCGSAVPAQPQAPPGLQLSQAEQEIIAGRTTLNLLLGTVAAIALLATGVLIWNGSLRRRVKTRTRQLNDELVAREHSAAALEESEQRIRKIIGTALDAVITMDSRGMTTGWSTQAEKVFGWSRDEAIGRALAELIIPVHLREAHKRGLATFLKTGEGPVLNTRIEITAVHKAGHELPVELAISPIQRGGSFEFCAFIRDITQRKQAEAELQQHRHRLEELVAERTAGLRRAKEAAEKAEAALSVRVTELADALGEVKQLRGLLPICSYCKRIREGEQYTRSVEAYLAEHTGATFSHGVCPDCYEKHVRPQVDTL